MTTKQIEPDQDSWRQQQRKKDRSSRNRRLGAFAGVAAMLVLAVVAVVSAWPEATAPPSVANAPKATPLDGYYLVALDGGSPVRIPGPEGSSWYRPSPDGERHRVRSAGCGGSRSDLRHGSGRFRCHAAHVRQARGTGARMVVRRDAYRVQRQTGGGRELFILEPSGRTRRLTTLLSRGEAWQPTWSPDDSTIAFVINSADPTVTIATIDLDNGRMDASVIPVAFSPDWAPNDDRLAYTAGPAGADRASVANADGSRRRDAHGQVRLPGRSGHPTARDRLRGRGPERSGPLRSRRRRRGRPLALHRGLHGSVAPTTRRCS